MYGNKKAFPEGRLSYSIEWINYFVISPSPSVASLAASFTSAAPFSTASPVAFIASPTAVESEIIGKESLSTTTAVAVESAFTSVATVSVFLQEIKVTAAKSSCHKD
ncbi:hypothetical protein LDL59_16895 [Kaistella anthropi]|nr:hypothetical protein [Kaistella anthropi]